MTSPTTTVTALARRFAVDIDTTPGAAPTWQSLLGIEDLKPVFTSRREKDEAYEDLGSEREAITGNSWGLELKLIHRAAADGVTMNATQEYLRTMSLALNALSGEAHIRWYDRSGVGEAWDGRCLVEWAADGGNGAARDLVAVKLSGQGARVAITNPNASPLPVVSSLTPITGLAAGGNLVQIRGRKLTGTTGIAFGVTAVTTFTVVDDTLIVAVAPAKAAGTYDVIVTTPAGASANTAADNYIYT